MERLTSATDEELMRRYKDGDDEAFKVLYQRHGEKVYGYLLKRLANRAEADDVFQSVFLRFHRLRHRYDENLPLLPWLFVICRSCLVDFVRQRARGGVAVEPGVLEKLILAAGTGEPLAASPTAQEISALGVPLSSLSEDQKKVIDLRYGQDLNFDEIARVVGTTGTNVRQILSRAIRKLRKEAKSERS